MALRWTPGALAAIALMAMAGGAHAGLEICNDTEDFQSVAIGYMGEDEWTSEGWWLIEPGGCAEPLAGDLQHRFYYYLALVDGADFEGDGFDFCTEPEAFTILGDTDCEARGFSTADFREIDTGETARHHVERITASAVAVPPAVGEAPGPAPEPGMEQELSDPEEEFEDGIDPGDIGEADDRDEDSPRRGASRL